MAAAVVSMTLVSGACAKFNVSLTKWNEESAGSKQGIEWYPTAICKLVGAVER